MHWADSKEINSLEESDVISASVCDPYVLIQRRDGTCCVYAGDTAAGSLTDAPIFSVGDAIWFHHVYHSPHA